MDKMNKLAILALALGAVGMSPMVLEAAPMQKMMDCSMMSSEMQEFASQLTSGNKAMFCGQFTDGQRASAMEMASKEGAAGMTMSPDEAVQKVSGANGSNPQGKTPRGCPVK